MGKQWKQGKILFGGSSRITADSDCSYEIKRRLLLERKVMANPDSILKSRGITLLTKVCLVKSMGFPAYGHLMRRADSFEKTKNPDAGKDWKQEEKGMTEDEMVGWHHWVSGHKSWVNSESWWWTGRPGMLQFMGLQCQKWLSDWNEKSLQMVTIAMKLKDTCSLEEKLSPT